jgi:hypothetical protein
MENSTEQSQKSKKVFMTMVGLLGLNAEVKDKASGKNIVLSVSTDEPGRLIGRNGSSLDSVGLLMNRVLRKEDNTFPKVIIDVDGYDKKSNKDRRNKRRKPARENAEPEKTIVMAEDTSDDAINLYVDDESGKLDPIVTVAPGEEERNERRNNNRRNNNRRNDNRNNNRRNDNRNDNRRSDNRNDNRRNDRAPAPVEAKVAPAPVETKVATAPVETKVATAPVEAKVAPAPVEAKVAPAPVEAKVAPAPAPVEAKAAPAPVEKAPARQESTSKPKSSPNRLQMQCRNASKEVKRWGEDVLLPPLSKEDCDKAIQQLSNEADIKAVIDSRSYGDKKRVRLSLDKK